jgi:hypothetical protein
MNVQKSRTTAIVMSAAVVVAAGGWYHVHSIVHTQSQFSMSELQPIATLLKENQALIKELQSKPFIEVDSGVLESYLVKIRRDGVPKHADMKQRLDTLAENNSSIVALINVSALHAKTSAFSAQADKFRDYAVRWRDRWNSVMELFMAGGNYAVAGVQFPTEFLVAVEAEMTAAKNVGE